MASTNGININTRIITYNKEVQYKILTNSRRKKWVI